MAQRQIVKTQKRAVFLIPPNTSNEIVGLTASSFWNYATAEGASAGEYSNKVGSITAGSAALSKVVCGDSCKVEQKGQILFQAASDGDFTFERFTIKSQTAGMTAAITTGTNGTAIVEWVL